MPACSHYGDQVIFRGLAITAVVANANSPKGQMTIYGKVEGASPTAPVGGAYSLA